MCLFHTDIIYYLIVLSILILTCARGMITIKSGFHILACDIKYKIICVYSLDYGKCYPKGILTDCLIQFNMLILGQMAIPVKCGPLPICLPHPYSFSLFFDAWAALLNLWDSHCIFLTSYILPKPKFLRRVFSGGAGNRHKEIET